MATLFTQLPQKKLATQSTPLALRNAFDLLSPQMPKTGVWLVGGTALAGFYAMHRRSDDFDFFVKGPQEAKASILAVQTLKKQGAIFTTEQHFPLYYHAAITFQKHNFTVDIVTDEALHHHAKAHDIGKNIQIISLESLFAMKSATLVSRCSEKDLFDLIWLTQNMTSPFAVAMLWEYGQQIDAGCDPEALLISLRGTEPKIEACTFGIQKNTKDMIVKDLLKFRQNLITQILKWLKTNPAHNPKIIVLQKNLTDFKS